MISLKINIAANDLFCGACPFIDYDPLACMPGCRAFNYALKEHRTMNRLNIERCDSCKESEQK
jgi:hypothetical protein